MVPGRAGAALTKPGRFSTARWAGSGERDGEEYARNRRVTPPLCDTGSNLADLGRERRAPALHDGRGTSVAVSMSRQGGCGEKSAAYPQRCRRGIAGLLLRRANHSEHGNRPGLAQPPHPADEPGLGASTADRAGRGGAAVVLRAGESPRTWGRAAAVTRRTGGCNAGRCTAEWRCPWPGPGRGAGEGIGDAGQASLLGGGRSWPPVR